MTVRLLVVDDDPRVRSSLRAALAGAPDLAVVAEVGTAGGRAAVDHHVPDAAVACLPELHDPALGALSAIGVPVVAVVRTGSDAVARRVVQMGAAGLVGAGELHRLVPTITRALAGETAVSDGMAPVLVGELLRLHGESLDMNAALELAREALAAQLAEMRDTYRATVEVLTNAVELRDEYTGGHVRRVCDYSLALSGLLAPALTEEPFVFGYMLHDIGKLAIPDAILLKPSALTDDEYELVKTHTTLGAAYVERISFLRPALAVVRSHHERWDGRGYPDGLAGDGIPLIARIFTVADSLDAMTTDRPYRAGRPLEEALAEFGRCAGSQFDPEVVQALRYVVERSEAFAPLRAGVVPGRDPALRDA